MQWNTDLVIDIRTHSPFDEIDGCTKNCPREITEGNKAALLSYFSRVKPYCKSILEIGVNRNGQDSFTQILLKNKLKETAYLGVDIVEKTFLNNKDENIYTIRENSSNIDVVMKYANSIGITQFDFIFIDGNHSINQVLNDWEYTKYLSGAGIVGFHDTAYHYGPNKFINNLNLDIWNVTPNACDNDADDLGIGFAWKK
jgi:hypothetical protein